MTFPPVEPSGRENVEHGVTSAAAGAKDYRKRIRIYLLGLAALTGIFLLINAPQCPESFTQEQVDASRCVIGANIGLGLYVVFVVPALVAVLGLLVVALRKQYGRRSAAGEGRPMAPPDGGTATGGGDRFGPAPAGRPASEDEDREAS